MTFEWQSIKYFVFPCGRFQLRLWMSINIKLCKSQTDFLFSVAVRLWKRSIFLSISIFIYLYCFINLPRSGSIPREDGPSLMWGLLDNRKQSINAIWSRSGSTESGKDTFFTPWGRIYNIHTLSTLGVGLHSCCLDPSG